MKTKNNYSKLRSQKNSLQNRLNMANRTVCLQIDEIKRLLNVLDTEQRVNQVLENKINLEIDKKNKTENKLIIALTISMFVITALVAILIKGF